MDPELLKWFASLGVGGALAGGMFMAYRKDVLTRGISVDVERRALLETIARHAAATERLVTVLAGHHETEVQALTRIEGYAREASHDAKNLLDRIPRTAKA